MHPRKRLVVVEPMHAFEVPIKPKPFHRVWSNGTQRFNSPSYTEWKTQVGWLIKAAMTKGRVERFDGPVSLAVVVGPESFVVWIRSADEPRPRGLKGDLDNYVKAILDAANQVLFADDVQVVTVAARFIDEDRRTLLANTMGEIAKNNLAADHAWLEEEGIDADG
jgi:Holliday junction resolvase RusA-like endonuclease